MEHEIRILRRTWRLVFAERMQEAYGVFGDCDAPSQRSKAIRVDPSQTDSELLDTILHEMLHAAFPWMNEDHVTRFATDQARAIELIFSLERIHYATEEATRQCNTGDTPATSSGNQPS